MKTYQELVDGLKKIKKQGWKKTHRAGDTGIGKTLEDLLDIDENNFAGPDGKETELKAARKNASSMLTLFTKSPLPRGINTKLRLEYGYQDEKFPNKPVLRTTIDSIDYNNIKGKRGFKIVSKEDRIEIQPFRRPVKYPDMSNPYWPKKLFEESIANKYKKSLLYVKADSRGGGENEEFHFNQAWLLQGFDFTRFSSQLDKGLLKVDIRLGLYDDGRFHDHGTGVRIQPALLDLCFTKRVQISL